MTSVDASTLVALVLVTLAVGVVLGFIGAGGAGVLLGILAGPFGLEIDSAIGTALAAMCFVTMFGAISHYREGNVAVRTGVYVGVSGMAGAAIGATLGQEVPKDVLRIGAGLALWVLAALMVARTRYLASADPQDIVQSTGDQRLSTSVGLGATGGISAGFLGVGMAPYLQLGFLTLHRLSLRQMVGTTMWSLFFISASGALVLAGYGDISLPHLVASIIGLSIGSFAGAKLTARAPVKILRFAVVCVPVFAGALVLFA